MERTVLRNGLEVVRLHLPGHSRARTQLHVYTGSDGERTAQNNTGYAHMLEHNVFKEGVDLHEGDVDRLSHAYGGSYNAYTDRGETSYHFEAPAAHLWPLMRAQFEMMTAARFVPEVVRQEKGAVASELQIGEDNAYRQLIYAIYETMLADDHPYRHRVIGSAEDVAAATANDLADFYARHYVPRNATLFLVGNLDSVPQERVDELWGAWESPPASDVRREHTLGPTLNLRLDARARPPAGITRIAHHVDAPHVVMAWTMPGRRQLPRGMRGVGEDVFDALVYALADPTDGYLSRRIVARHPGVVSAVSLSPLVQPELTLLILDVALAPGVAVSPELVARLSTDVDEIAGALIAEYEAAEANVGTEKRGVAPSELVRRLWQWAALQRATIESGRRDLGWMCARLISDFTTALPPAPIVMGGGPAAATQPSPFLVEEREEEAERPVSERWRQFARPVQRNTAPVAPSSMEALVGAPPDEGAGGGDKLRDWTSRYRDAYRAPQRTDTEARRQVVVDPAGMAWFVRAMASSRASLFLLDVATAAELEARVKAVSGALNGGADGDAPMPTDTTAADYVVRAPDLPADGFAAATLNATAASVPPSPSLDSAGEIRVPISAAGSISVKMAAPSGTHNVSVLRVGFRCANRVSRSLDAYLLALMWDVLSMTPAPAAPTESLTSALAARGATLGASSGALTVSVVASMASGAVWALQEVSDMVVDAIVSLLASPDFPMTALRIAADRMLSMSVRPAAKSATSRIHEMIRVLEGDHAGGADYTQEHLEQFVGMFAVHPDAPNAPSARGMDAIKNATGALFLPANLSVSIVVPVYTPMNAPATRPAFLAIAEALAPALRKLVALGEASSAQRQPMHPLYAGVKSTAERPLPAGSGTRTLGGDASNGYVWPLENRAQTTIALYRKSSARTYVAPAGVGMGDALTPERASHLNEHAPMVPSEEGVMLELGRLVLMAGLGTYMLRLRTVSGYVYGLYGSFAMNADWDVDGHDYVTTGTDPVRATHVASLMLEIMGMWERGDIDFRDDELDSAKVRMMASFAGLSDNHSSLAALLGVMDARGAAQDNYAIMRDMVMATTTASLRTFFRDRYSRGRDQWTVLYAGADPREAARPSTAATTGGADPTPTTGTDAPALHDWSNTETPRARVGAAPLGAPLGVPRALLARLEKSTRL
jgi:predicted Zn-dependent peptidase